MANGKLFFGLEESGASAYRNAADFECLKQLHDRWRKHGWYAVGFKIVYLWNHQILSATFTSFIWWLCLAIIVFDIVILVLLMKDPLWSLIAFLKLQVLASIGTAVLFVILGFSQLKTWLQTRLPKGT